MNISKVITFLEGVKETHGDIRLQLVTGFWIHQIPRTGEWVVVCSTGDGKTIDGDESPSHYFGRRSL